MDIVEAGIEIEKILKHSRFHLKTTFRLRGPLLYEIVGDEGGPLDGNHFEESWEDLINWLKDSRVQSLEAKETNEMAEKYCKDCGHYENHGCRDREDAINLVSGKKVRLVAADERSGTHYHHALIITYKPCGREAIHFVPKPE